MDGPALVSNDNKTAVGVMPYPPPAVRWFAVFVLAFLYWMSMLDKFIISLLVEPIKADLQLTDVQFGLLQGMAFIVSYTLFGFIFGALADHHDRRKLIFIGVTCWSLASAACGFAQNFWHLLIARVGLGAGESSLNPCGTSMIGDLFPRDKLTSAMAVYAVGATLGSGTALVLGGLLIHWVTGLGRIVLPVVGYIAPWQAVFFIVGLPGLLLAFLVFSFPEPVRRDRVSLKETAKVRGGAYGELFSYMASRRRFFLCHHGGFLLCSIIVSGCMAWYPVHMIRAFGWSEARVGMTLGTVIMAAGAIGKLASGCVVDFLYRRGYRDAQLRWYAYSLYVGTPIGIVATLSDNPWVFLVLIGFFIVLNTSLIACAKAALILVTPNQLRGSSSAVFTTAIGMVGSSAGAVLIPLASEHVFSGESSIGLGMALVIGVAGPLGATALMLGLKPMREALAVIEGGGRG